MSPHAPPPPLLCPHCQTVGVPLLQPGTGPHVAKAVCGRDSCRAFIKWLPKLRKETTVRPSINRVLILGELSKHGVEVRYSNAGAACASFTLIVSELGQDNKEHQTYVNCECWGKKAEAASELAPGQLAVFDGKLRARHKGESWELYVAGFELQALVPGGQPAQVTF